MVEKGYAIYDKDVKAEDKYKLTSLPNIQFKSRKKAEKYAKNKYGSDYKILVVYGLPARMIE